VQLTEKSSTISYEKPLVLLCAVIPLRLSLLTMRSCQVEISHEMAQGRNGILCHQGSKMQSHTEKSSVNFSASVVKKTPDNGPV
jgi:hypothetical protein